MAINITAYQKSKTLQDHELLPPNKNCSFCGSENRIPVFTLQTKPPVLLLKCNDCNVVSASRMPTNEALSLYYENYYRSEIFSLTGENVTSDDSDRYSSYLAKRIYRFKPAQKIKMLDLGGGDGSIAIKTAIKLTDFGVEKIEILVVDIHANEIAFSHNKISVKTAKMLDSGQGKFEVVLASAILEHLPDSHAIIQTLLKHTVINGLFFARTPSVVPVIRFFGFFGIKLDFTFPGHLHDMGQAFWTKYLRDAIQKGNLLVLESKLSPVETKFSTSFFRTMASGMLKLPWYIFGEKYGMVGGWSIFVRKLKDY